MAASLTPTISESKSLPEPLPKSLKKSHFLSGGASGVLSAIVLQPADLLKTRLQQATPSKSATATLISTLKQIATGPSPVQQLWRGTVPSAIRTGVGSALYFSALHHTRHTVARSKLLAGGMGEENKGVSQKALSSSLPQLSPMANLTTGAITRAVVGTIMMPITIIKVRYESTLYSYTSILSASKDIYKTEGIRGFFSGWGATAIRDAPYAGLYVLLYEHSKKSLSKIYAVKNGAKGGEMDYSTAAAINTISGAGAGALATAITNPFDALKTRIQVAPEKYRNLWHAASMVVMEDAAGRWKGRALFDGLGLRMARKAVSSAVVWGLYEGMVR
ncbi:hypothetical protein RUND412_003248 [Rhizina undulata]